MSYVFDCGYGDSSLQDTILGLTDHTKRSELRNFIQHRWNSVSTMISFDSGLSVRLTKLCEILEASDTTNSAFVLGGISARLAIEIYLSGVGKAGRSVERFLHRAVFTNPLLSKVAYQNQLADGREAPDYIVCDSEGDWHVVEAKGSLQSGSDDRLARGLGQALNLKKITTPSCKGLKATSHRPKSASVVGCGFQSSGGEMHIVHIDPPGDVSELEIEFSVELADLASFLTKISFWKCINAVEKNANEMPVGDAPYRWHVVRGMNSNVFLYGIASLILRQEKNIRDVIEACGTYIPAITAYAIEIGRLKEDRAFRLDLWRTLIGAILEQLNDGLLDLTPGSRENAVTLGEHLLEVRNAPDSWANAVRFLLSIEIDSIGSCTSDFHVFLLTGVEFSKYEIRLNRIVPADAEISFHDFGTAIANIVDN
jgi:hypothetical protein